MRADGMGHVAGGRRARVLVPGGSRVQAARHSPGCPFAGPPAALLSVEPPGPRGAWLLLGRGVRRMPRMAISLRPAQLKRYKDIVRLVVKYGRLGAEAEADGDFAGLAEAGADEPTDAAAAGLALAADLEALGPTFIKLGQLLATRADLLPVPYLTALARLQDRVEPFDFEEVRRIVEAELGVRLSKAFSEFRPAPLAAA